MDKQEGDYEFDSTLVYDLRQYYARIVGEHLIEIAIARKERNFQEWMKLLECLHTEIRQKLDENEEEEYQEIFKETKEILLENKDAFTQESKDVMKNTIVFNAINELDIFLRIKMEEHGMFGRKEDEGL